VVIAGPFDTQFFILGTLHIAFRTTHHDVYVLWQKSDRECDLLLSFL
jgi:hypothetical protein